VDAESAARRWVDVWSHAWPAKDSDAVASLYAADATFRSHPFRDVQLGSEGARAYADWAFSEQDEAECWFGEPVVEGDRAAIEYWAVVRFRGADETIAGIAVVRFGADGLVRDQRDYWSGEPGRREPPDGWGR
jgi:ketosteroid isomerase-like protein